MNDSKWFGRISPGVIALLKAGLIFLSVLASSDGVAERFEQFGDSDNPWRNRAVFAFLWVMGCGVALVSAFLRPLWLRIALAVPLCAGALASMVYQSATGAVLNYGELFTMWASRDDWMSAVRNYGPHALGGLFMATVLFMGIVIRGPVWRAPVVAGILAILVYGLPVVAVAAMLDMKGGAAALGVPAPFKVLGMFTHILYSEATEDFDAERQKLDAKAKASGGRPHIVVIVDESIRGDYLSINGHPAETTPFLHRQTDRLFNFGIASSSFECSHFSNLVLRFGLPETALREAVRSYPSVWEFARNAGYQSNMIDAQRRHGELSNFMTVRERKQIDNFVQFSEVDAVERTDAFVRKDEVAAQQIARLLKEPTPQFIYVNKEGAHAPYEGKYPESETKFRPSMKLGQSLREGMSIHELENSYRNAVRWSVDHFFSVLLKDLDLSNSVIIYTADHGQNLLEKGVVTHCGRPDPAHSVALVPMFVITEHPDLAPMMKASAARNFNKASHFNVPKTVINLLGYDTAELPFLYDPALTEPLSTERRFFTGNLLSGDLIPNVFSP